GMFVLISKFHLVSISFWNNLFLISLLFFVVSGFLFLIEQRTFDRFLNGFRIFYKKTTKLEKYVANVEYKETNTTKPKLINLALASTIVKCSGFVMLISITVSYFFYYK